VLGNRRGRNTQFFGKSIHILAASLQVLYDLDPRINGQYFEEISRFQHIILVKLLASCLNVMEDQPIVKPLWKKTQETLDREAKRSNVVL